MQQFKFSTLLFFCLLAFAQNAHAQATLSIQGVLQKFNGSAVDDGQYDITFRLYTTDAGGTALWSETQTTTVTGGVYSVLLGAVNPLTVPFDQPYYVGLTIPGGPEHTPRTQLTAAPYALAMLGQDNKFPSTGMVQMSALATGTETTTATSYTVGANDHVIYLDHTANQNVTLPAATAANTGRQLLLVNKAAVAKTLTASNYVDVTTGATSTTVPANSAIELQSDGSVWRQTGGYVTPGARARVYCHTLNELWSIPGGGGTVTKTMKWTTEVTDAGGDFDNTTGVFTAPRTGIYHLSGSLNIQNSSGMASNWYANVRLSGTPALTGTPTNLTPTLNHIPDQIREIVYNSDVFLTAGQTLSPQILISGATGAFAISVLQGNGGGVFNWLTITEY